MSKERDLKYRPLRGKRSTGSELERLVLGGTPGGRRDAARSRSLDTDLSAPVQAISAEAALTHTPRPRKKKRRV